MVGVADLLAELGSGRLIQIIEIDDDIHVLVCGDGRVRHLTAGRMADAARAADFARFALRRVARLGPADDPACPWRSWRPRAPRSSRRSSARPSVSSAAARS